jgi:hypothetical protein
MGDVYVCWSPDALYVGIFVIDIVETGYYRDEVIPEADRAVWRISVDGSEPVNAVVGAGRDPVITPGNLDIRSLSGTYHNVRCIAAVKLPASSIGKERLQPGDKFSFDSSFTSHARAYETKWKANFVLSE